ncbi:MAG: hypothetical protein R3B68_12170 [Phycisphaerales bacterium]
MNAKDRTPGPDPERLKINIDWDKAAEKAVTKPVPPGGVPDRDKPPMPQRKKKPSGEKPKG